MAKSKLKPSTGESFAVGKTVGSKEAFEEVLELIKDGANITAIRLYSKARVRSLVSQTDNDPFKQKATK